MTSFAALYTDGDYLQKNPTWHAEESPWKVRNIVRLMERNHLAPATVCEVGCGAGEVLRLLQQRLPATCAFQGYDISPQALALARTRANDRLRFELADIARKSAVHFDLLLVLDVVEHVEDYFSLLRAIKPQGDYKILHIPLDLSVESVLRGHPILQRRDQYGHIHYFTKDLALRTLEDMGYRVLDHLYTRERRAMTARGRCLKGLRTALFRLQPDLAARLIGGFRLMVLAR